MVIWYGFLNYGMPTGPKYNCNETKTLSFCFTAKSLKTEWNKNILFLFHCQITGNWVKQKHFVFVSMQSHWQRSETKTFWHNILFLFHCQINDNWVKQKHKFLFECQSLKMSKKKFFLFVLGIHYIVKILLVKQKHLMKPGLQSKWARKSFCFVSFLFTFTKV